MLYSIVQVFDETVYIARSWSFPLAILIFLLSFIPLFSFDSRYIRLIANSIPYSYGIMCGHIYVVLQWYWVMIVDFIAWSDYFRLSLYTCGIFLACRFSSRLRFNIRGMTHDAMNQGCRRENKIHSIKSLKNWLVITLPNV